jgi:hypothetical protein
MTQILDNLEGVVIGNLSRPSWLSAVDICER